MKLDRNITTPRRGKYALIKLRQQTNSPVILKEQKDCPAGSYGATYVPVLNEAIDYGTGDNDFFVIRLKDKYAAAALLAYADAVGEDDPEYANEIVNLALKAQNHPQQKRPD